MACNMFSILLESAQYCKQGLAGRYSLKSHTHYGILPGVINLASQVIADSRVHFMMVSHWPVLNMFSILLESAKYCKQQLAKWVEGFKAMPTWVCVFWSIAKGNCLLLLI